MAENDESGERSHEPTQKKLDDARKRGDVAKSLEVNTWFLLSAGALSFMMFGSDAALRLTMALKAFLAQIGTLHVDGGALTGLAASMSMLALSVIALPLLLLMIAAVFGSVIQTGLLWSTESLTPKFSKVSPIAGFGRLFSKQSLANFAKGLLKLGLIGTAVTVVVWPERQRLGQITELSVEQLSPYVFHLITKMLGTALAVLAVLAGADWFYQRHSWMERQRMSFQEIKDEYKQQEGDPKIKARIRQIGQQRSRKRMMAQVPQATVIITNPTHFAVALKYESGMNAPLCVGKGQDAIALRIRALAQEHAIPIVENPPLARALYATVEIDDEIPADHYKAVAEVIGYVMKLRSRSW